jgi:hypothetical protein
MKPSERFNRIYTISNKVLSTVGCDLKGEYPNWRHPYNVFYYCFLLVIIFPVVFYVVYLYITQNNLKEIFNMFFTLVPGVQLTSRWYIFMFFDSKKQFKVMMETKKMLEANEKTSVDQQKIVNRAAKIGEVVAFAVFACYFALIPGFTIFCWIHHLTYGSRFLPYASIFMDISTEFGYLSVLTYHSFISHIAYSLFSSFDSNIVAFATQIVAAAELFILKLKEGSNAIAKLEITKSNHDQNVKTLMKEIIEEHRKYNYYLIVFLDYASSSCFWIISMSVSSIAVCMITIMTSDFYAAYGVLIISLLQLLLACVVGTIIEHQNAKILAKLWEFDWYNLPISDQKMFLFILLNFQNPVNMKITFIGLVDMKIFTMV